MALHASTPSLETQADVLHRELRAVIISHTGHEHDVHQRTDRERYNAHQLLANVLNSRLQLGMDKTDQQLLALINTSLSYANRFEGDPYIAPTKGESPVKHSAHAAVDYMNTCYHANIGGSADEKYDLCNSADFQSIVRDGALICLWHDGDEVFGEPTTVHSRAVTGGVEQDSSQGIRALHYAMTLAMHALEQQKAQGSDAPIDAFFTQCTTIRDGAEVKQVGYDNIMEYMRAHPAPKISAEGEARVAKALRYYAMAEQQLPVWHSITDQPETVAAEPSARDNFLSDTTKSRERNEGNSHYNRFFIESGLTDLADGKRGTPEQHLERIRLRDKVIPHTRIDTMQRAESNLHSYHSVRLNSLGMMKNLEYGESKVGSVLKSAHTPLEQAIARKCALASYRTMTQLLASGPQFIDRFPETRADYAKKMNAARGHMDEDDFLTEQGQLRLEYYANRDQTKPLPGSKKRHEMPEIISRQEMISTIKQTMQLIEHGREDELLVNGKYEGIVKRRSPLPESIDLNKPIPQQGR